jgi:hypothetical protein
VIHREVRTWPAAYTESPVLDVAASILFVLSSASSFV